MRIQRYPVIRALQPYIKLICAMDCDDDADTQHIRVLPDTCTELFVNYTSTPVAIIGHELFRRSIITSRMNRPADVQMRKGSGCMAVCFYPGMAYRFFHLPMHVLSNITAALADIWKDMAAEIEDRLAGAADNDERAAVLQQYLIRQLAGSKDDKQVAGCLGHAQLSSGTLSVKQLTDDTGISQRHLSRRFRHCVGLSPKEYLRVSRFIQSLKYLKQLPANTLTEIAYKSGYYDQAHFIRDYRTYTGCTPGEVARSAYILY